MINIQRAFSYPFEDKEWPVKILIGTLLSVVPIVNFMSRGYSYRVLKGILNEKEFSMPEWGDWGKIFIEGLMVFLISFCYYIIPMVLVFTGVIAAIVGVYYVEEFSRGEGILFGGVFIILLGIFLYFVATILYPMALVNYIKNDERFTAAFRIHEIIPKIFKVVGDYLIAIILMFSLYFFIVLFSFIPFIGIFFSLIQLLLHFYIFYLLWVGLFGTACAGAYDDQVGF
jgi:hypothetical protein